MTPFVSDPDFTLYVGDVREVLRELPAESVDCCVTSPPYFGLRDYGTDGQIGLEATPEAFVAQMVAVFRGVRRVLAPHGTLWLNLGDSYNNRNMSRQSSHQGGLGFDSADLQKSWVELKAEGRTRMSIENGDLKEKDLVGIPWMLAFALRADGWYLRADIIWAKPNPMPESVTDRPTKSHEYVFLLSKNPRYFFDQEAVREPAEWERWGDQTNGKHEGSQTTAGWIGSKSKRELVKRRTVRPGIDVNGGGQGNGEITLREGQGRNVRSVWEIEEGEKSEEESTEAEIAVVVDGELVARLSVPASEALSRLRAHGLHTNPSEPLVRSVWEIATQPYPDAHFATFPEALPERCIKAGCPERVCRTCGKPSERIVEAGDSGSRSSAGYSKTAAAGALRGDEWERRRGPGTTMSNTVSKRLDATRETLGWSDCGHGYWACESCGNVLDRCDNTEDDQHNRNLPGVPAGNGRKGSVVPHAEVLLQDVQQSVGGSEPGDDEGLRHHSQGLQSDLETRARDGDAEGVHPRASSSDGADPGASLDSERSGASPERGQARQPALEPRGDGHVEAQPTPEASPETDHLSSLQRDDHRVGPCPACGSRLERRADHLRFRQGVTLDPFMGSGTTALVARRLGRRSIGIELNPEYAELCARRLQQLSLLAEGAA